MRCVGALVCGSLLWAGTIALGGEVPFSATLTLEQRAALGLSKLTATELAALDAAVADYSKADTRVVAQQAATAAVEEYKKKEEPGVVARALDIFRQKEAERRQERFTGVLLDSFRGWDGDTTFRLDNGQVWRQAAQDRYHTKPKSNVLVVIYKAASGYWRLRVLDDEGAWVTVKRVQ